jgi:hypothetical protein
VKTSFKVDVSDFGASLAKLSRLNGKSQGANLLSFAKTTLKNRDGSGLIDITPPAKNGAQGTNAKKLGEKAILRDLNRVFAGVKLKGKQKERHPDVSGIHRRHFIAKKPGKPMRSDSGDQKYFVDERKLTKLKRTLFASIGKFASGWAKSASSLGVSIPAFVRRHGGMSRGSYRQNLRAPRYEIEMTLNAPRNSPAEEMERRVRYALTYTQGRIRRAIEGALKADAAKSGLKVL